MVQFQKLKRNLILILHGQNVHRQHRQLSKFRMRYQQVRFSCLLRGRGASLQHGVAAGKGFLRAPAATPCCKLVPRSRSKHEKRNAGSACETWTVVAADGVCFARVRWEINFLLTFEIAPFICKRTVYLILWLNVVVRNKLENCMSVCQFDTRNCISCIFSSG